MVISSFILFSVLCELSSIELLLLGEGGVVGLSEGEALDMLGVCERVYGVLMG